MIQTKEEILWSFPQGESEPYGRVPVHRIYEAMDKYAKQEAIEFYKFMVERIKPLTDEQVIKLDSMYDVYVSIKINP